MQPLKKLVGPVSLIADAGSPLADRIAANLAARGFPIDRIPLGHPVPDGAIAAVVLAEHRSSIDAIAATLGPLAVPALVLAGDADMVDAVLPMLWAPSDLGLASDATDVVVWRLTRLIDLARLLAAAQTQIDALTGLCNRRAFETHLSDIVGSVAPGATVGLLYLDLDRFKLVNDALGHMAGDCYLRALGEHLSSVLAPDDVLARLGGDEFGCILTRPDTASLIHEAERLINEIASVKVPWDSAELPVMSLTASAGLTFVRPGATTENLMYEADVVTYEAKNAGRNRVVVYGRPAEAGMRANADLRLRHFESATRLASERLAEMISLKSRRLIDMAKQEACICHLTGLYNRGHFDPALSREMERAHTQVRPLSLALIDVDQFGEINKTHGWPTGDRVLQSFAAVARANVRATDWIARYAGDEFVIVMPDTPLDSALNVVERVRQAFASAHVARVGGGGDVSATLSAGVAQLQESDSTTVDFVNQASDQLKTAKGVGRNQVLSAGVGHEFH